MSVLDDTGVGMSLSALQESLLDAGGGAITLGDVDVPLAAFNATSRRLTAATCTSVALQKTEYIGHNIYHWVVSRWHIPQNASIKRVEVHQCGTPVARVAQPIEILLAATRPPTGNVRPVCVRFDE